MLPVGPLPLFLSAAVMVHHSIQVVVAEAEVAVPLGMRASLQMPPQDQAQVAVAGGLEWGHAIELAEWVVQVEQVE